MTTVAVLAVPGGMGVEIAGACHVFATAVDPLTGEPLYEVRVCGRGEATLMAFDRPILTTRAPYGLASALDCDTVIVPAVGQLDPDVVQLVREAHERGIRIASVCTGAFQLAAAGILDGRRATTHWRWADELQRSFPAVEVVPDALYVDEGDVLTSAGVLAGFDLCLHLVRRDHGAAVAAAVARQIVMAPHRDGGQAQFTTAPAIAGGDSLEPVLHWMRDNLAAPLSLDRIAEQAHVSTRTLSRRFRDQTGTTPLQWLTRQRVWRAQELLETTTLNVTEVAAASGFASPLMLRKQFAATLGITPTAYRRSFAGAEGSPSGE